MRPHPPCWLNLVLVMCGYAVLRGKGPSDVLVKELTDLVLPQLQVSWGAINGLCIEGPVVICLQQVFVSLPELIHQKWQFNSICKFTE